MNKLEVFFDYLCPFCLKGHEYLLELYPSYPHIELVWRPCEAHPRPENRSRHSDLCIQGMYFALDQGVDIWAYHERMYQAAVKQKVNTDSIDVLAEVLCGLLDTDALRQALETGVYAKIQRDGNTYAFEQSGVWAVPSYRMNGLKLDSIEGVGITKEQLAALMDTAKLS